MKPNLGSLFLKVLEKQDEMESADPGIFSRPLMASLVFTHERGEKEAISDFLKWPSLVG